MFFIYLTIYLFYAFLSLKLLLQCCDRPYRSSDYNVATNPPIFENFREKSNSMKIYKMWSYKIFE